jgi:hypothetical protein
MMKELVLEQLRHLSGTITVLRGRVREAVAGEVGKAVAEAVADVLTTALGGRLVRLPPFAARYDSYAGHRATSYGRPDWDEPDAAEWQEFYTSTREPADPHQQTGSPSAAADRVPAALAMALTAGRWWLVQKRSPWGAAGVGLAVGGALLAGGPIAQTVLGVLWAVHRLMVATEALGDSAKALRRV